MRRKTIDLLQSAYGGRLKAEPNRGGIRCSFHETVHGHGKDMSNETF